MAELAIARDTSWVSTADKLTQAMERCGYNQRTLALALGVHPKTVAGWVHGRYTPKGHRARLADLLGEDVMDDDRDDLDDLSPPELLAHAQLYLTTLSRRLARDDYRISATPNPSNDHAPAGRTDNPRTTTTVRSPRKRAAPDPGAREQQAK